MSIASFELLETDLTANTEPGMKFDINGEKCALIKIQTTEHNFTFDVGVLNVEHVALQDSVHPGEIWLYVPEGVKSISLQHPVLGAINKYDLGQSVKKGKTYLLVLTTDQVNTMIIDYNNSQYLKVAMSPPHAELYLNGLKQQVTSAGICEVPLPFGRHNYRVTAPDYYPEESQITIDSKDKKHELRVILKQAFGYLTIPATGEYAGAIVYVDKNIVGTLPLNRVPVKSGKHDITISKKLYDSYNGTFEMTDSGFVTVNPVLNPNYADVALTVPGDREGQIFVNGEFIGSGKWEGRLESGRNIIEVRKASHRPSTKVLKLKKGESIRQNLDLPTPIYGSVDLQTSAPGANVIIDGKQSGITPYVSNKVLIGNHTVEFRKKGYKDERITINVEEGKTVSRKVALTDYCSSTISLEPRGAFVSINGAGPYTSPHSVNLAAGDYKIMAWARGYKTYVKTMRLDGKTEKNIRIKLHYDYARENEFYLQAGYNALAMSGITFGMGGYIHNVNLEANYILGMQNSETIYWCDTNGDEMPFGVRYKASGFNAKIGYGIGIGSRMRLTPQIGCQYITIKDTEGAAYDYMLENCQNFKALSCSFGMRCSVALAKCVGLSVTPEYLVAAGKSDGFKAVSDISSKVKNFADGFGCNISAYVFF